MRHWFPAPRPQLDLNYSPTCNIAVLSCSAILPSYRKLFAAVSDNRVFTTSTAQHRIELIGVAIVFYCSCGVSVKGVYSISLLCDGRPVCFIVLQTPSFVTKFRLDRNCGREFFASFWPRQRERTCWNKELAKCT